MKLNREQIVKALENAVRMGKFYSYMTPKLSYEELKDALALILELTEENAELQKKYAFADAEREANVKGFTETIATLRADTVRKMQEKLKAEFKDCCRYIQGNREYFIVGEELIDRIAKELLEVE